MKPYPRYKLVDGTPVPSVTTLLGNLGWSSRGLMFWANKLGREGKDLEQAREELADAGKLCHLMAQHDIQGKPAPEMKDIDPAIVEKATYSFAAYQAWRRSTRLEPVASEVALVSETLKYGGRLDAVAIWDGSAGIIDFKSSKELYPDALVQIAAYARLWDEAHPDMLIKHRHCLRWNPEGGFAHHSISDDADSAAWTVFRCLLKIHEIKGRIKA